MDFSTLFTTTSTTLTDTSITALDIFFVIFGTFVLSAFIAWVYKHTYHCQKKTIPSEYAQTLITLSVVIAMIMLTIGSNIAGAFTMAGALAMVRFRNNIKDSRDIGFIFFAIAIGMSMGMQLYLVGILGTLLVSLLFFLIYHYNLFSVGIERFTYTLTLEIDATKDYTTLFSDTFEAHHLIASVIGVESILTPEKPPMFRIGFSLESTQELATKKFIDTIRSIVPDHTHLIRIDT